MKIAVTVLVACIGSVSGFWFESGSTIFGNVPSNPVPGQQDCKWLGWEPVGPCLSVGNNQYRRKQIRDHIPAKNGGKPCVGDSERSIACTVVEYTASMMKETINTASNDQGSSVAGKPATAGQPGVAFAKRDFESCPPPIKDSTGATRIAGKKCTGSVIRRRRSAAETFFHRMKRNAFTTKHRDVLFLIDESGSVNTANFKKFLNLARAITNSFCGTIRIDKSKTRVGVMSFDKTQHPQIDFDEYFQKAPLLDEIENIPYNSQTHGSTCLIDALQYTKDQMFTTARGARPNDPTNTERMVILMTDGCANCRNQGHLPTLLTSMRQKFEAKQIPIIAFFVGTSENCVNIMQGLVDGALCYQLFRAMNFNEVEAMTNSINNEACMDTWKIGPPCPT